MKKEISFNDQLKEITRIIDDFDSKFGHINPDELSKEDKKEFVKANKKIDNLRQQKQMLEFSLNTMKSFGCDDIVMG